MTRIWEKCLRAGKCCAVCGLVIAVSAVWNGKAEAGSSKNGRYCLIVPPERYKPAVEPVRHVPDAGSIREYLDEGRVVTFFKGQMKKVGLGTPDCFRIEPEEAAALAAREPVVGSFDLGSLRSEPANLFPERATSTTLRRMDGGALPLAPVSAMRRQLPTRNTDRPLPKSA